ncbi:MAG TPA: hypothetical protein VFO86_09465 [Terriglobia bacterium]|nr:hypothetical protein [Terriglobia bacterium]
MEREAEYVNHQAMIGMAGMLCLLRDLFTATPIEVFSRDKILVMLKNMAESVEIFPNGEGIRMWEED